MDAFGFPDKRQTYSRSQTIALQELQCTPVFYWDLNSQQNAEMVLTRSITMGAPVGWEYGKFVMMEFIQGGAGSFTVTYPAAFFKNMTSATLVTAVGSSNRLVFKCIENGVLDLVSNNTSTRA